MVQFILWCQMYINYCICFFSYLVNKLQTHLRNSNRRPHSKISPAFLPFVSFPSPCLFFPSLYPTLLQPLPSHLLTVPVLSGSHRGLVASDPPVQSHISDPARVPNGHTFSHTVSGSGIRDLAHHT